MSASVTASARERTEYAERARVIAEQVPDPEMPMLPACTLPFNAIIRRRESARNERIRAEQRRCPSECKINSEFEILHDMSAGEVYRTNGRPGKSHARSHQLAWESQSLQSQRANLILDDPCKFRHTHL